MLLQYPARRYFTEYGEMSAFFAMLISIHGDSLGCYSILYSGKGMSTFQKNITPPFLNLKMETVCSYKMLISAYQTRTRCRKPGHRNMNSQLWTVLVLPLHYHNWWTHSLT
jgi:hypothetical protein